MADGEDQTRPARRIDDREARRAAALRNNLHKRKHQARCRARADAQTFSDVQTASEERPREEPRD